jgi:hypothetical protein
MLNKAQLLKKIARLESINDHLNSEVKYVDQLMRLIGFADGLQTVKETAKELLEDSERREAF